MLGGWNRRAQAIAVALATIGATDGGTCAVARGAAPPFTGPPSAADGWAGPLLSENGWTGLGLFDGAWAAYRRPAAIPPAPTPPADTDPIGAAVSAALGKPPPAPAAPPPPAVGPSPGKPWVWERIEYPAPIADQSPAYRSYVALLQVDCRLGAVTNLQWTTYIGNNLGGGVAADLDKPGDPEFVVPDSIDDALRKVACAWK